MFKNMSNFVRNFLKTKILVGWEVGEAQQT